MDLSKLFFYIVSLSVMGSILSLGLLIIKKLFRQKLSANWHYYIWFVLILRLILPFSMSPASINFIPHYLQTNNLSQRLIPNSEQQLNQATGVQTDVNNLIKTPGSIPGNKNVQLPSTKTIMDWFNWQTSALIWMLGVTAIFSYILLINSMILFKTKKLPSCDSAQVIKILQRSKSMLNIQSEISIVYDYTIKSPAIYGFFKPKIIISPELIKRLSSDELSYIFLHELSHLKRRDLLVNSLMLAIQVIYWFNPVIWLSLQQMKQDCEIACDASVLAALKLEEHKKYGQTIITLLQLFSEPRWAPGSVGFVSKFNTRRITMISKFHKTTLKWSISALALTLVVGCSSLINPINPSNNAQNQTASDGQKTTNTSTQTSSSSTDSKLMVYKNTQYGFSFSLPADWKGYSIVDSQWQGLSSNSQSGDVVVETGPIISIRDPRWTKQIPRQDIPIMVFTLGQWNSLQQEVFHIGAAPIGPSELGRNNSYVFALPARYNFAFPPGYEEVNKIIESRPLQTIQTAQQHPDSIESLLSNMMIFGQQGKVLFCDFPVKYTTIEDIEKAWGYANKTEYIAAASGRYATYPNHNVVFGINKGDQIFEVRSYDSRLKGITLERAKEVLGAPAYDAKSNNQEIMGYTTSSEFKVELIFPLPTSSAPNPTIDHYNVLYPQGTVNTMADNPGRQW